MIVTDLAAHRKDSESNSSCCANPDTLWFSSTKVAVVGNLAGRGKGVKRTAFGPTFVPYEFFSLSTRFNLFPFNTCHLFALAAQNRLAEAGIKIVFLDPDS